MNKKELKNNILDISQDFFNGFNYSLKKTEAQTVEFVFSEGVVEKGVVVNILDYSPEFYLGYYVYEVNGNITALLQELGNKSEKSLCNECHTFTTSYSLINKIKRQTYLPPVQSLSDLKLNLNEIQNYLLSTLFPMQEKYENLTTLNQEINGDDFWETDWRKPFNLGGNFEYKRIIIAHLANLPEDEFDIVVKKQRTILEGKLNGEYGDDFKDVIKTQDTLVKLLKS